MGIAKTDRHHAVAQRVIMDLHYTSGQMAQLRQVISAHLELWGLIEVTDTGMLVASELCSNVRHVSDPGYELTLSRAGSSVRVEVRDKSTVLPELPTRPPDLLEVGTEDCSWWRPWPTVRA